MLDVSVCSSLTRLTVVCGVRCLQDVSDTQKDVSQLQQARSAVER